MSYSCLISRLPIKENEEFYVIPLVFKELMVLEKADRYANSISRSINLKNELYRVALLPIRAKFVNSQITLIEDNVSKHFQEKTKVSFQEILNSFVFEETKHHSKYFEVTNGQDRVSKQIFPCFVRKKVWDKCIEQIRVSDSLWNNFSYSDHSFLSTLGFKKESDTEYSHFEINNLKIRIVNSNFKLELDDISKEVFSVNEIESILNSKSFTLGSIFVDLSKELRVTRWEILQIINKKNSIHFHFEDLSPLFSKFYDEDIVNLIPELTQLIEILNVLFASNMMLEKPKYVPNLCDCEKHINDLHRLLISIH